MLYKHLIPQYVATMTTDENALYLEALSSACNEFIEHVINSGDESQITEFIDDIFDVTKLDTQTSKVVCIASKLLLLYPSLSDDGKQILVSMLVKHASLPKFVHLLTHRQLVSFLDDNINISWNQFNPVNFHLNLVGKPRPIERYEMAMCIFELCFVRDLYSMTTYDKATLAYNIQTFMTKAVLEALPDRITQQSSVSMLLCLKPCLNILCEQAQAQFDYTQTAEKLSIKKTAFYTFDGYDFVWSETANKYFTRLDNLKKQLLGVEGLKVFDVLTNDLSPLDLFNRYKDIALAVNNNITPCDKGFDYDLF